MVGESRIGLVGKGRGQKGWMLIRWTGHIIEEGVRKNIDMVQSMRAKISKATKYTIDNEYSYAYVRTV